MNCKPGDLALVTKGAKSSGRIVRCIRLLQTGKQKVKGIDGQMHAVDVRLTDFWEIEGWCCFKWIGMHEKWVNAAHDSCLRPIRDQDGPDESLEWAGLPKTKEKEHV